MCLPHGKLHHHTTSELGMEPELLQSTTHLMPGIRRAVSSSRKYAVSLAVCACLLLCSGQSLRAQGQRGLELEFAGTDTITVPAGTAITFQLVARTAGGDVDTNWDLSGVYATLRVLNTTAESDTSTTSWNSRPAAFSWLAVTQLGIPLQSGPGHEFSVSPLTFNKGVITLKFISTKAERNVRIEILPAHDSVTAISPCINIVPGPPDNFLVDMTEADASQPVRYFVNRPVEFVVTPRDEFLNTITDSTPVRFLPEIGFELDSIPGLPNPYATGLSLHGPASFYLRPKLPRPPSGGKPQVLTAYKTGRWDILGAGEPFFYDVHPPNPFALTNLADLLHLKLPRPDNVERFTWERPSPPDPYTGIRVSAASQDLATDTVRYTIHFLDATTRSRTYSFDSDDDGLTPAFSRSHSGLADIIDSLSGIPDVPTFDVIWYVEATDGDWVTRSTSAGADSSGRRLKLTNEMYADKAVALHFPAPGPFTLDAGDELCFELQAQDTAHTIVEDWNAIGRDVTLLIRGTAVDADTSTRAWDGDTLGFSWSELTVRGQKLRPLRPGEFLVPHAIFENGRAPACYRTSKAENKLRIEISPLKTGWIQQSPEISWIPGVVDNLFVDITWPSAEANGVYVQRDYEVVLHVRDRFLNPVAEQIPVRLDFRYPDEVVAIDSTVTLDSVFNVMGTLPLRLLSTKTRGADTAQADMQEILMTHEGETATYSHRQSYSVLPHAPLPFSLYMPVDNYQITLFRTSYEEVFSWKRPQPPDPYTGIRLSRYSDSLASDDIRYRVYIVDEATLSSGLYFLSDDDGRQPQLTMTHGALIDVLQRIAGSTSARVLHLIWYVEATDGLYLTRSNVPPSGLPGYRLWLEDDISLGYESPLPVRVALIQNYPNPFNPSTRIEFTTTRRGPVTLRIYNLLGEAIATLHEGMLDAGNHVRAFDGAGFPAGVYVCRLEAEGLVLSTRMVLLR